MQKIELKIELELLLKEIEKLILKKNKDEMSKRDEILLLEIREKFDKCSLLLDEINKK